MASTWFLQKIAISFCSSGPADAVMLHWLRRWSQSDKFISAVVKRIASNQLFVKTVAVVIKQHVHSNSDECRMTQIYVGTEKDVLERSKTTPEQTGKRNGTIWSMFKTREVQGPKQRTQNLIAGTPRFGKIEVEGAQQRKVTIAYSQRSKATQKLLDKNLVVVRIIAVAKSFVSL